MSKGKRVSSSQARASHECIMSPRLSSSSCHLHHNIKAIIKAIIIIMSSSCTSNHHHLNWTNHHRSSTISSRSGNHQVHQLDHGLHHKVQRLKAITKSYIINKHHQGHPSPSSGLHYIIRVLMGQHQFIMSTSINLAASYCDHCKGHHQASYT